MSRDRPRSEYEREVQRADERDRDAGDTSTDTGFVPFAWPTLPGLRRGTTEVRDERRSETYDDEYERERAPGRGRERTSDDTWLDEGFITLLLVAGVALFLFPEPGTSAIGLVLIGAGVLAWLVDLAT